MEVKSTTKYVRLSPQKAREVAREIQGKSVSNALDILNYTPKKAAVLIGKTLKTAIADAENNFSLDSTSLVVKEAVIGAGPTLRRSMPRAKGSANAIIRRTSNIYITLTGEESSGRKKREVSKVVRKSAKPASAKEPAAEAAPEAETEVAPEAEIEVAPEAEAPVESAENKD